MTKVGKCDRCRQRKVKCDEGRPICGVCKKGGRLCQYTYGKVSRFVTDPSCPAYSGREPSPPTKPVAVLSLRSSRGAKSGDGVFQTLVPVRIVEKDPWASQRSSKSRSRSLGDGRHSSNSSLSPPSIPRQISQGCLSLQAQWISLMRSKTPDDSPFYVFGDWMSLVPLHIGQSEAIDAAASCLIDSTTAFANRTEHNLAVVQESNAKALKTIRLALLGSKNKPCGNEILIAVKLLFVVEIFLGVGTLNYRYHAGGLVNLLRRMCPDGSQYDEIIQHIFYSSFISETTVAILTGQESIFAGPYWSDIPPPSVASTLCPDLTIPWSIVMKTYIEIPRLIRLVRQARQEPENYGALLDAGALAHTLLDCNLEGWFRELLDNGYVTCSETTDPLLAPWVPFSLEFASTRLFMVLTSYWIVRVYLFGCFQSLHDMHLAVGFDFDTACAEDILAAERIVSSTQYAMRTDPALPVVALRHCMPLQIAYAAWHRLERRELQNSGLSMTGGMEGEGRGSALKRWSIDQMIDIQSRWSAVLSRQSELDTKCEAFIGGPLGVKMGRVPPSPTLSLSTDASSVYS